MTELRARYRVVPLVLTVTALVFGVAVLSGAVPDVVVRVGGATLVGVSVVAGVWLHRSWRPGRPRWVPAIVGQESGAVHVLPFPEFRSEAEAREWCDRMNAEPRARHPERDPLTVFEPRPLD